VKSELEKAGLVFLKKLADYADVIIDIYLKKQIPPHYTETDLEKLLQLHILWRPNSYEELHLTKALRELLQFALQDERNRQIDSTISEQLAVVKILVIHYKESLNQNRYLESENYLTEIGENIFLMMATLRNNLRLLWSRIHNEFALVATLNAKIRENELAQNQTTAILTSLELINFADLAELAGHDRELRRLLLITLQKEVENCLHELKEIQQRLLTMLGRFKQIQLRCKIIRGFDLFLDQHPEYMPHNYSEQPNLSPLFNQIKPIPIQAYPDINIEAYESLFIDLIQQINCYGNNLNSLLERKSQTVERVVPQEQLVAVSLENQLLEKFFLFLIEQQGQAISAKMYYDTIEFPFDREFWLFAVLGYFDRMSQTTKKYFNYQTISQTHPIFNGNRLIEDILVWMN
jgi:hypothetical protein